MTGLRLTRYSLEWAALMAVCTSAVYLLPPEVLTAGHRLPAALGVGTAGVAGIVVYAVLARAMVAQPSRVIDRLLLSVLGKFCFFGACGGLVAWLRSDALSPYLLALATSFLLFSFHQVVRLVMMQDRIERERGKGTPG